MHQAKDAERDVRRGGHPELDRLPKIDVLLRPGDLRPGVQRGWLSPEAGARGPLHVATAPELAHTTGRFFGQRPEEERPIRLPIDLQKAVVQKTSEVLAQGLGERPRSPKQH
jgi:hypothetical protein